MKYVLFTVLGIFVGFSSSSHAAGKTLAVCNWQSFQSDLNRLVIHEDSGGQLVALYTTEGPGDSTPTLIYRVERANMEFTVGFNRTYIGKGISLSINGTVQKAGVGFPGVVSIPSMQVRNQHAFCKVNSGI